MNGTRRGGLVALVLAAAALAACTKTIAAGPSPDDPSREEDRDDPKDGTDAGAADGPTPIDSKSDAAALAQHVLTVVSSGSGAGSVASRPSAIDCGTGSTCSSTFAAGTSVTLEPTPAAGSRFVGWSGACSGSAACLVEMKADATVTATFERERFPLAIAVSGNGVVSSSPAGIDCGSTCNASFDAGTSVTLIATPAAYSTFLGWSGGGCSGTGTCVVAMSGSAAVTASFRNKSLTSWDPAWSVPGVVYSNSNLSVSGNSARSKNVRSTVGKSVGKWYWEVAATAGNGTTNAGGLGILEAGMANDLSYIGFGPSGMSFGYGSCCSQQYWLSWTGVTANGAPPANSAVLAGNVYMFALDMDAKRAWVGMNGTWFNGGSPAAGTMPAVSGLSGTVYAGVTFYSGSINAFTANFGNTPFSYAVPAGFNAGLY